MRNHRLILEAKTGANGQIRLIESKDCESCHGFMFAMQRTSALDNDYFYSIIYTRTGGTDSAATTGTTGGPQVDFVNPTLFGK